MALWSGRAESAWSARLSLQWSVPLLVPCPLLVTVGAADLSRLRGAYGTGPLGGHLTSQRLHRLCTPHVELGQTEVELVVGVPHMVFGPGLEVGVIGICVAVDSARVVIDISGVDGLADGITVVRGGG